MHSVRRSTDKKKARRAAGKEADVLCPNCNEMMEFPVARPWHPIRATRRCPACGVVEHP